jgi:hypothetical protein
MFLPLVLAPMTIPDLREPGEVIDCMACVGDGEPARAFLQLPSQNGPGLLRMVAPGGVGVGDDNLEGVRLSLLEGHDSGPACLPNCYVRAVRFGIPETTPYPAEIAINSAIVGSEDAERTWWADERCSAHKGGKPKDLEELDACMGSLIELFPVGSEGIPPRRCGHSFIVHAANLTGKELLHDHLDRWAYDLAKPVSAANDDIPF